MINKIDMSKVTRKDLQTLANLVQWAIIFSNRVHSPDCEEGELCKENEGKQTYCSHMGFHRELKRKYNILAKKVGAKVAA